MANVGRPAQYTAEEIISVIPGTYGILNRIAKKLDCTRQVVLNYVNKYPELKEAIKQEKENNLDIAEGVIYDDLTNVDTSKWILAKLGKDRGYQGDLQRNVEHSGEIVVEYVNDYRNNED